MLIAFAVYFIVVEEVHWRIHLGGWLPALLTSARSYHLAHHDIPNARYNIFLPLFDLLFGNLGETGPSSSPKAAGGLLRLAAETSVVYFYLVVVSIFFRYSFYRMFKGMSHIGGPRSQARPFPK
jgi:hypothetical protein